MTERFVNDVRNLMAKEGYMVRAKFVVLSIKRYDRNSGMNAEVEMRPVYSSDPKHENKAFWDATPSGQLTMAIKSDAADYFEPGAEYYLDFTKA